MRPLILAGCVSSLLLLSSCSKQVPADRSDGGPAPAVPAAASPSPERAAPQGAAAPSIPRRLVRTVDLDLVVAHTPEAADAVQKLAARLGGYVASIGAERSEGLMRYTITLRVPADRLDAAVAELKGMSVRTDREQQKTEDVTDQFVDLDARLRTLRATEAELQGLLAESRQSHRGAKEIMEIYGGVTEIRTKIEQIQGQLNVLDKLSTLATINLQLSAPEAARPVAAQGWQPVATVRDSVRTLIGFLYGAGDFAIFAVIVLLPAALILGAVLYVLRRLWRRLRRRRAP